MAAELITLPIRLGVRAATLTLRASGDAAALALRASEELASRGLALASALTGGLVGGSEPSFEPDGFEPEPEASEPAFEAKATEPPTEPEARSVELAPEPETPSVELAPEPETPSVELPPEPEPAIDLDAPPEPQPAHVSEDPVLAAEFAEPGAEDGAGAEVHVDEPWPGYRELAATDLVERIAVSDPAELAAIQLFESAHQRRQTVLSAVHRALELAARGS